MDPFAQRSIVLTGGAGDLGKVLAPLLLQQNAKVTSLDILECPVEGVKSELGSILDRGQVQSSLRNVDLVIHIAAWHGFHEFTGSKSDEEFWDLNMTGTFNLLDACRKEGCQKFLFISSTSVDEWPGIYGMTKVLGENLVRAYAERNNFSTLCLRPRAFIPHWNRSVYKDFLEWAAWFARGAVHIEDFADSVLLASKYLLDANNKSFHVIEIDGKQDFSQSDLKRWESLGARRFLSERFDEFSKVHEKTGFCPDAPPTYKDLEKATALLGYSPKYGYGELFKDILETVS